MVEVDRLSRCAVHFQRIVPAAAGTRDAFFDRFVLVVFLLGEITQHGTFAAREAVEPGQFADRRAGARQFARGRLHLLCRVEAEERVLAREHILDDRVGPAAVELPVVGDEGYRKRVERADVFRRTRHVGRVGAAFQTVDEVAVRAQRVVDDVVDGVVERRNGVAAVVVEIVEVAGHGLEGDVQRFFLDPQPHAEGEGFAGLHLRTGVSQHRGEEHRLDLAFGVVQGHAEAVVIACRQGLEGHFPAVGRNARRCAADMDERGWDRAGEGQRHVGLRRENPPLPDHWLPQRIDPAQVEGRGSEVSHRVVAFACRGESELHARR